MKSLFQVCLLVALLNSVIGAAWVDPEQAVYYRESGLERYEVLSSVYSPVDNFILQVQNNTSFIIHYFRSHHQLPALGIPTPRNIMTAFSAGNYLSVTPFHQILPDPLLLTGILRI